MNKKLAWLLLVLAAGSLLSCDPDTLGGDNCPELFNPDQIDSDADGDGDACDTDDDDDGILDDADNCRTVANDDQMDGDSDDVGDVCDNCPQDVNTDQTDTDTDGIGDICDPDIDGDTILDDGNASGTAGDAPCVSGDTVDCDDNCPLIDNPLQEDADGDGIGDACDS